MARKYQRGSDLRGSAGCQRDVPPARARARAEACRCVNVLDENILESQRQLLRGWRISVRQIGHELGRKGMQDQDEVIPFLLTLRRPTLFTRDLGLYGQQSNGA